MNMVFWIIFPFGMSILVIYFIGRCCADTRKHPYDFKCSPSDKREAFERWHDHQVEQMGTASNTLFALASAGLAYSLTLLSNSDQTLIASNKMCLRLFICAFGISFLLGFLSIFNRLEDFRRTKERHRLRDESPNAPELNKIYHTTRRIGAWTWGLLYAQGLFFIFGASTIFYFWIANYGKEL